MTMNQIYLSEVSNKHNKHPMKIVVGGIYTGEGLVENPNMSYYRIDLEDNFNDATGVKDPTLPLIPFDIIRNHSYIFNITQVDNPGTPTPDTALDSDVARLKVEILDYIKLDMKGLPDQYTLSTDKSVILFDNAEDVSPRPLEITTDYEGGWEIEPVDGNSEIPDWVVIDMKNGPSGTKTINISPKRMNRSITREAHFYVTAGKIRKEITVVHPQPPTANCYLASGKDNELIVGIIGNGETGTHPEGQNILEGKADATLTPYRIGIIWETKAGLVKLQDPRGNEVSNTSGKLTLVDYDRETMSIKYNVYPEVGSIGGKQGGNALIGAFDENGKVLWSWHIWVCPDVVSREGNTFNEDYLEHWKVNDYDFMDRNLGALANRPNESAPENQKGVAAMGLLYQWGRKDPFIGPNYSNDNFSGEGRIDVVHYYQEWETYASPSTDTTPIAYTIEHPTHLIWRGPNSKPNGLSQIAENGSYLWGTNGGFSTTIIELGSKTIYDPCPVGYRVPPVNAFVFKSPILNVQNANNGLQKRAYVRKKNENLEKVFISWSKSLRGPGTTYVYKAKVNPSTDAPAGYDYYSYYQVIPGEEKTSLESNWNENLRYIPHKVKFNRPWWGDGKTASMWNYEGFDWNNNYIKNAKYYGFYINYKKIEEPESVPDDMYHLRNDNPNEIAWFPLTGAYDPTKGVKFKDGNNTVSIQHGSSISVNSFLWSNSSVKNDGRDIPAAMFLHGTESGTNTTLGSGRHIHGMMQSNVKADPHYAGAVRCIKDRTKTEWSENRLTPQVTIKSSKGSSTEITIVSVSSNWILTEPGAPWLVVSPDRGAKTDKNGRNIKITMLKDMPAGSSTTLTFRIAAETEPRKVVVTVT